MFALGSNAEGMIMPGKSSAAECAPEHPAWESSWEDTSDPFVAGYFGIQAEEPEKLDRWATRAFCGYHAPFTVERGLHIDGDGARDYVYIAYWRQAEYRQWWALAQNSGWWRNDRRTIEGVGYWREIIAMPFNRFETLHSSEQPHGVGVSAEGMAASMLKYDCPVRIRDRLPISQTHNLRRVTSIQTPLPAQRSATGRRVSVTSLQNMCVIRSGQDWSACGSEEKTHYLERIVPRMFQGLTVLRDNPVQSGCYSLRFFDQMDEAWHATEKSFVLGYAVDVHALENWAGRHPTHLILQGGYSEMNSALGTGIRLALWREVTALPKKGCDFEYIACRPGTGLLRHSRVGRSRATRRRRSCMA